MIQIDDFISKILPHKASGAERLLAVIKEVSSVEQREEDDICQELIGDLLAKRESTRALKNSWDALSAREQEITAFACLGQTNRQISARLYISEDTVKTHIRNVTLKFGLRSKADLRAALAGWDFREWGK